MEHPILLIQRKKIREDGTTWDGPQEHGQIIEVVHGSDDMKLDRSLHLGDILHDATVRGSVEAQGMLNPTKEQVVLRALHENPSSTCFITLQY